MATRRSAKRPAKGSTVRRSAGRRSPRDLPALAAEIAVWALLLIPPFLVWPGHADSFDLPKLLWSEALALLSLLPLAWRLAAVERWSAAGIWRLPAVRAVLPAVAVASTGWLLGPHAAHTREALPDLWIGAACLIAWSVGLEAKRLRRLVAGLLLPASAIGAVAVLQFHDLYRPFEFAEGEEAARLGVTSLAGNAGVLADYLVLPALVAQWLMLRGALRRSPSRVAAGAAGLAVCLYGAAVTQTVVALLAIGLGSVVFWLVVLPRRRALQAVAAAALVLLVAVVAVAPLRAKIAGTGADLAAGDWDRALAGRLDGWRTAVAMLVEHPLTGVGHGAYAAEFAATKLELADRGVEFFRGQEQPMFVNAHNELLEVAAEWGPLGLLALAWGIWVLIRRLTRRHTRRQRPMRAKDPAAGADLALAWAGVAALGVAALGHFPLRVALVAYPAVLFLAWALRPGDAAAARGKAVAGVADGGTS